MKKVYKILLSSLFFIAVWLFWWLLYPQALSFREQNQLLLLTWSYLGERLSLPGGLADYLGEFITQFNVIIPVGAALMAGLLTAIQLLTYSISSNRQNAITYVLSFIPSLLLLITEGNLYMITCFPVAVCLALAGCLLYRKHPSTVLALVEAAALWWLAGPAVWAFIAYAAFKSNKVTSALALSAFGGVLVFLTYVLLNQYPLSQILFGITYCSITLVHPAMQHIVIASVIIIPLLSAILPEGGCRWTVTATVLYALLIGGCVLFIPKAYNIDIYEILALDQLVRQEKWNEVIERAEKYQPKADIACVSINLSLFMTGQFERLDDFYQCGTKGLLMPRVRDYISNVSTGEAFWRLGFVNAALRYAFDTQESNPTLRKNPRSMMRMAECQILNGRYKVASKYIDILKHTIFYRKWAVEEEKYLYNEQAVLSNPLYSYILSMRQDKDYLFYYPQMDRMLTELILQNSNNELAKAYYIAWMKFMKDDEENQKVDTDSVHGN